jgi:hypothetical protein
MSQAATPRKSARETKYSVLVLLSGSRRIKEKRARDEKMGIKATLRSSASYGLRRGGCVLDAKKAFTRVSTTAVNAMTYTMVENGLSRRPIQSSTAPIAIKKSTSAPNRGASSLNSE